MTLTEGRKRRKTDIKMVFEEENKFCYFSPLNHCISKEQMSVLEQLCFLKAADFLLQVRAVKVQSVALGTPAFTGFQQFLKLS